MPLVPKLNREALKRALEEGPRSDKGDPCFSSLDELALFFCLEDVLALVNKSLYAAEYQTAFHRKRAQEMKDLRALRRQEKQQASLLDPQGTIEVVASALAKVKPLRRLAVEDQVSLTEPSQEDEEPSETELRLLEAFARTPLT